MKVIVYSQPDCPPCEWTKEFLSRRGIAFTVKDIRVDPVAREELLSLGFKSTPVTFVDGVAVVGFDQEGLLSLLSLENTQGGSSDPP
jgi:glutaredoxin